MQIHSINFLLVVLLASALAELSPLPLLRINLRSDLIQETNYENLHCTDLISVGVKIYEHSEAGFGFELISECYHATTLHLLSKY